MNLIERYINESIDAKKRLLKDFIIIEKMADMIIDCFKRGNKVMLCGNGGSAADSQHIAAEFVNKFMMNRRPLPAISLTNDMSILTSVSNDYGFEHVFEKQVEALGRKNDVLIALSTSGKSKNVIKAVEKARKMRLKIIALTGKDGIATKTDLCLKIQSKQTPRIQEAHITALHIVCDLVEKKLFS